MSGLYWDAQVTRLHSWSSAGGPRGFVVRIELRTADEFEASALARQLAQADLQRATATQSRRTAKRAEPTTQSLPAPLLALPAPERTS